MLHSFLHDTAWADIAGYLGLISLVMFVTSLICIPLLVARLPQNVFLEAVHPHRGGKTNIFVQVLLLLLRNIFGVILLLAGILMLFLPGQGLLTIVIALLLLSFPGKKKMFVYLIYRKRIQRSLDWLRRRQNKQPFHWPE